MTSERLILIAALVLAVLTGCDDTNRNTAAKVPETPPVVPRAADPHSFANFAEVAISHLELNGRIDFSARQVAADVILTLDRQAGAGQLILDTRDLDIESVTAGDETLSWRLADPVPALGSALTIDLPQDPAAAVHIRYRTSPQASGLQWLTPEQTAGKQHPFMFSQSQAIHARSWIPLQDTPAVRFTFTAKLSVPEGLRAVMGASNDPGAALDGEFEFAMPQAIPSYLMALAAGHLAFAPISERAGVYAEPELLAAAAQEFADTEAMMVASEALFGPYRWGRYDLLILPPSFPFGGMENPRLSFITPTVIAGDRSLVSLIAHELAHSWSGNLVTNASWDHMWLNEGFTVYLEARIMEALYGPQRRAMEDVLGYQTLLEEFKTLDERDQHLVLQLTGRDADDAFSSVPYEKGRLFLVYLSQQMGTQRFDDYLRGYFDRHAFSSMTTDDFVADLRANWPDGQAPDDAALNAWLHQPGLPDDAVLPRSDALVGVDDLRRQWLAGERNAAEMPVADWTPHHWLHFLNGLPALTPAQLAALDSAFNLTGSGNNEIAHAWLRIVIAHHYEPALGRLKSYLSDIGRLKLIEPLYEDLMAQPPWGPELARSVYLAARPGYHPLTQGRIDALIP